MTMMLIADADDHNVDADAGELKVYADASVNGYQPVKEQPALTETCSMSFLWWVDIQVNMIQVVIQD